MKALVIIPIFDEGVKMKMTSTRMRDFLEARSRRDPQIDIMLMDDGSPKPNVEPMAKKFGFLSLRNPARSGVGFSIRRAYDYGLEKGYDILITMAGNNKDNPDELDQLMEPIVSQRADFVQGSRYLSGGNFGNMPFYRLFTTRYIHPLLFSLAAGKQITDSTNGFRAIRASVLRDPRLNLHQDWLDQYELEPYLFHKAIRLGYRVTEVPVTKIYPDKKLGYSKMKPIIGWWSILRPVIYLLLRIKT
ncbi:MAG: glycosyltransferase family 2 protein [Candidatus Omnitrophica bacterium]|nr:glycosyltransferase family 2 protein [Candidatus Omnitrophota bacterium]